MSANNAPVFPKIARLGFATITTANTALDGTGTVATAFTADATNGSRVDTIKVKHLGTNVATVLRIFINNGSTNATATNNSLYVEQTMPASTVSQTASSTEQEIAVDLVLPPGHKLLATIGTTVAAGIQVTICGGDF